MAPAVDRISDVKDAVVAAYLTDGTPNRALSLYGITSAWVTRERRKDVEFALRIERAQEQREVRLGEQRAAAAAKQPKLPQPRKGQTSERDRDRAEQVARLREDLERLLPLLREGMTVKDALTRLKIPYMRMDQIRRLVPEAQQQIHEAYAAGAGVRKARTLERRRQSLDGEPEAQATRLFVAALAAGRPLTEAHREAGASAPWITKRYLKNEEFKKVVDAVLVLRPDIDFPAWLEEASTLDVIPRRPRPRRSSPHP
ncbi:hypothetical protein [Streptomyces graminifolii]|uniref:hypothetical protein n=1 Tax=Streptomyces graminifolii TaxID=1266771 RepID=UPI0040585ADC